MISYERRLKACLCCGKSCTISRVDGEKFLVSCGYCGTKYDESKCLETLVMLYNYSEKPKKCKVKTKKVSKKATKKKATKKAIKPKAKRKK